jgi:hypothetical protein
MRKAVALPADQELRPMINDSNPGRGRCVAAAAAVGVALLAAGCGGSSSTPRATGSSDHQKLVAFAKCMRSHGVPDWPDPLPGGGFPRESGGNSPQSDPAMKACQHLLPPVQPPSAAQQARMLAKDLRWARCMRSRGFPGISDPSVRPHTGVPVITAPAGFDPGSPQAQAAAKACQRFEGPFMIVQGGGS